MKWIANHGAHGQESTLVIVAKKSQNHLTFNGIIPGIIWGATDVYAIRLPMPDNAIPLLLGQVTQRNGSFNREDLFFGMRPSDSEPAGVVKRINERGDTISTDLSVPMMPIAWIKSYRIPGVKRERSLPRLWERQ